VLRAAYQFARKTLKSSFRGIEAIVRRVKKSRTKLQAARAGIVQASLLAIFYIVALTQMPKQLPKRFIGGNATNGR
jgi:ABC-type uncharacterized transport system fused permease/ATPase subunit